MKKLVIFAALALITASPALAKSRHHAASPRAVDALMSAYGSATDPFAVMQGSRMVGRDPDPAIRLVIRQQAQTALYSK